MKLRHPWLIAGFAFFGALLTRWWLGTLRYHVHCCGPTHHPIDPRKHRFLYVFWHESLLGMVRTPVRGYVMISKHADGELIARVCRHLGIGTVRGSTTRGGGQALLDMMDIKEPAHLAVTPDGPRGPRRRVQQGVIFLASRTGVPIVAIGIAWGHAWRARSWDRFALPRPYSDAYGVFAPEIHVPPDLNREQLESYRLLVERTLSWATEAAERWADRHSGRAPVESPATSPAESLRRSA